MHVSDAAVQTEQTGVATSSAVEVDLHALDTQPRTEEFTVYAGPPHVFASDVDKNADELAGIGYNDSRIMCKDSASGADADVDQLQVVHPSLSVCACQRQETSRHVIKYTAAMLQVEKDKSPRVPRGGRRSAPRLRSILIATPTPMISPAAARAAPPRY